MSDELAGQAASPAQPGPLRGRLGRWLLSAVCVGLGVGGGLALDSYLPRTYVATTDVYVLPTAAGTDSRSGAASVADIQIDTEAQLVRSAQVAAAASEALGGEPDADTLLARSSVTVPSNSTILSVSYRSSDPKLARDASAALAQAYLARRDSEAEVAVAATITSLEANVAERTERLQKNAADAGKLAANDVAGRALSDAQRSLLVDEIADLNSRLVELKLRSTSGGQVITEASVPTSPSAPVPHIGVVGGTVVGLLAATGILLFWRGRSLRAKHQAGQGVRIPALALLWVDEQAPADLPAETEVLDKVCRQIAEHDEESGPLVLLGVGNGALRARAAVALAERWSAVHTSAVLVVADPAAPALTSAGSSGGPGFVELAQQTSELEDVLVTVPGRRSSFIRFGLRTRGGGPGLQRFQLLRTWLHLERDFDTTLVLAGSPLDQLGAQVALTAGRIVLLVDREIVDRADYRAVVEELDWLGLTGRTVGMVALRRRDATSAGELRQGAGRAGRPRAVEAVGLPVAAVPPAAQPGSRAGFGWENDLGAVHDGR